ncbi:MAG: hypothetical protein AAF378_04495 [Cyanobacteria bacterium P01_A01_bin.84]
MNHRDRCQTLIKQVLETESDRLDSLLENNRSCLNDDSIACINEKAKSYKKPYNTDWAKLQMTLAIVHFDYGDRFNDKNEKLNIREEGVKYCNKALKIYQREKCDHELVICHKYLDKAYEQFVGNLKQYLKQYASIVPEKESVVRAIKINNIAGAYFSPEDEYTPSDVVVEIIIHAAKYSKDKKTTSLAERVKWRKANHHLYQIIEALNVYGRYHEKYNYTLGKILARNNLIQFVPQDKFSISYSLKLFIENKGRTKFFTKDDLKEKERKKKNNGGKPLASLDERLFDENQSISLVDTITYDEPNSWEILIKRNTETLATRIEQYIRNDPEGRLKRCHPRGYPQANCQSFADQRILQQPKVTLEEIAETWKIPKGTLFDAREGKLRDRFYKLLQEIAIEEELKYNLSPEAIEYIKQDKSNRLKNIYPNKHPQCNCQALATNRLLAEISTPIAVLAEQWKISEKSLVKHWRTNCLPELQKVINNSEYL